jgi:hypothetical protein
MTTEKELKSDFFRYLSDLFLAISPVKAIGYYIKEREIPKETILDEYKVPTYKYLQYLIYNTKYWYEDEKEALSIEFNNYIENNFDDFKLALEFVNNDMTMSVIKGFYDKNISEFNKLIIDMAPTATSKTIKNFIIEILETKKENKSILLDLLKEKKAPAREIAVMILTKWNLDDTIDILKPMLESESNNAVKSLIGDYLAKSELETTDESDFFTKKLVLERAKKENASIYGISNVPNMVWQEDNKELPEYFTKYLISLLKKGDKVLKATEETKKVISLITIESLTSFLDSITDDYIQKQDWYLRAIPFSKSDKYLNYLKDYIIKLIRSSRGATAAKIVDVIAEFKTTKAVQMLDFLSLKKNANDARVNRASVAAMDTMAKEMNLTKEDLLDFIIPNFGFDKKGKLELDFGARQFIISLQPDLTMLISDAAGKTYKNLPKVGKDDDVEKGNEATNLFKLIKKDLKKQVKLENERLERGFSESRFWNGENWLKLFVNNPIMRTFAMSLIWGKYKDGVLLESFRYLHDGSFSNIEDEELNIKNEDSIALIHPIELTEEQLNSWKEMLNDYEITQPFEQINRPIFKYSDQNKDKNALDDFKGFMLGRFALKNNLFKHGWSRGAVEDAGCYYYYDKVYGDGTFVSLDFLGDYVGNYDDNKEVPIYDIKLNKNGKNLKISEIPPRLYSELYYELKKVTEKGSGFNAEWEKVSW